MAVGGQPNNKNAEKHDKEKLAASIDAWSRRDDAMHIMDWVLEEDLWLEAPAAFAKQDESFAKALKTAKYRIAKRLREKLHKGEYNYGLFQRELSMYDLTLRTHEREEKQFEADLRRQAEQGPGDEYKELITSFSEQLTALQKENEELRKQLSS